MRTIALLLALVITQDAVLGQGQVLGPVADAYVNESRTGTNAGSGTTLRVRVKSRASYRSFLRFDLTGLSGTLVSARLRLFCTDASTNGGQLYALPDNGWSEMGITWANQPALPASPFAALGPVSVNTWVELDVTAALGGTPTQVFALAGGSSNSAYYSSREGSNPPQLVLEISGGTPVAAFSGNPLSGTIPLTVNFTDLSSGGPTVWAWDFGDGGTSTEQNPAHVYDQPGTYTVRLDVTGEGGSDELTRTDYVTVDPPPPPEADFSGSPLSGAAPLTVAFVDLSRGEVSAWLWEFGDGASSVEQAPIHTYTDPGTFSVSLTVAGPDGTDTLTRQSLVRVFDPNAHGIWTSAVELAALPMSGPAWDSLLDEANQPTGTPAIAVQGDDTDVRVLAKALVFARTGDERYRLEVIDACMAAIGTEQGGRILALGRNLIAYVISAELVGLPAQEDAVFRTWLRACLTEVLDDRTLISTHERRPNNWGTHAGASRAAVAQYLGDAAELDRCAAVFHGFLGNRNVYAGFLFGELSWQADPSNPVGVNPLGATREGHSIDGVLPDDQRRAGAFEWPPPQTNYVWESLQGALAQAVILHRAGYDAWNWEDQALLRAVRWLHEQCNFPAAGDDTWLPHIVNHYYGTDFPAPVPSSPGKNLGWTDWTLSGP